MLKNYFKIAIRQLRKQKMYAAIKIGGFALSLAACLLIALFIKDELSYDKTYPDGNRMYRIIGVYNDNGKIIKGTSMPPPLPKAMQKDFPEVENTARLMAFPLFYGAGSNYVTPAGQEKNIYEDGFTYVDQSFLDIFHIPMVYGDRKKALAEPNTIVISKRIADKYFPSQDCVGKILFLNNDRKRQFKIGGVMQDFPATSYLKYDFFLTLTGVEFWQGEQAGWGSQNYETYLLVRPGTNMKAFQQKMSADIINNYVLPEMVRNGTKDAESIVKKASFELQPVSDIHLKSFDIYDYQKSHSDMRFVWLFGAIACFILIIACINFINLSTAKSANRAKEVGLRKVIGSFRSSLIKQFLTESLLYSFLSFVLAVIIAWLMLPLFNTLANKSLNMPLTEWWFVPVIIAGTFVVGFLAGIYPSYYLSAFKPISVLKGNLSRGTRNSLLRNGLVVFQFATSVMLIIATIVIYSQTKFMLNREVGFDKDQVLIIEGTHTLPGDNIKSFKQELLRLPQVKSVSISDYLPIANTKRNGNTFYNEGKTKEEIGTDTQFWIVDDGYVKTMGMKMVVGRNFSSEMLSDSQAVVINQKMADQLHLKDPVGKIITNGYGHYNIVGVVADFNYESMRDNIGAVCLKLGISSSMMTVKANGADMKGLISSLGVVWKKFAPTQPLRYEFMDESFANMYADVQRMTNIFTSFAVLAIIIACLGLFALSAFMAEQRNKEISIRKVLGASVSGITAMLSKDFVKLVLISIVIASPIAWWAMTKWLQDFQYRTPITWWMFGSAALLVILIALMTISFQAIKAAIANPAKTLRSE
ncbi:MAG: ABC transporter permease [Bacteroidetes bacterium]|nr:ABC transporter permease [Bacteroidota bacterium]